MRIGIVGLGDIAAKAYLPVITALRGLELVLCTRNEEMLKRTAEQYRIEETASSVEAMLASGIEAVFVHAATEAHASIIRQCLEHDVHVFVDNPIAYAVEDSRRLVELSEQRKRLMMVGFNRRFAPMYAKLKQQPAPGIIVMEKNRTHHPGALRTFILDDFIHVVDTLLFLMPERPEKIEVQGKIEQGLFHHVTLQLIGSKTTAVGIMNRDSGMSQEMLEVMSPGNKWVVSDLVKTTHYMNGEERTESFGDWTSTLARRGFPQMIEHFLRCVRENGQTRPSPRDALFTHEVCEHIVRTLGGPDR